MRLLQRCQRSSRCPPSQYLRAVSWLIHRAAFDIRIHLPAIHPVPLALSLGNLECGSPSLMPLNSHTSSIPVVDFIQNIPRHHCLPLLSLGLIFRPIFPALHSMTMPPLTPSNRGRYIIPHPYNTPILSLLPQNMKRYTWFRAYTLSTPLVGSCI